MPVEQRRGRSRRGRRRSGCTSPSTSAEHVAGPARPATVSASRLATADLGVPAGAGRLGHRDHVVVEAAGRVAHGERGQRLHRRPGRHHADPHAVARAPRAAAAPATACGVGVVGQHHHPAGAGGRGSRRASRRSTALPADAPAAPSAANSVGQPGAGGDHDRARAAARVGGGAAAWSSNRVTEIRCGRPAATPASIAAPTSLTWTWTFQVAVAVADRRPASRRAPPSVAAEPRRRPARRRRAGTAPRTRTPASPPRGPPAIAGRRHAGRRGLVVDVLAGDHLDAARRAARTGRGRRRRPRRPGPAPATAPGCGPAPRARRRRPRARGHRGQVVGAAAARGRRRRRPRRR